MTGSFFCDDGHFDVLPLSTSGAPQNSAAIARDPKFACTRPALCSLSRKDDSRRSGARSDRPPRLVCCRLTGSTP